MSDQENVKTVEETYAAFERGDIQAVLDSFSEEAEWFVPGPTTILPHAGRRQGREQIAQYFAKMHEVEEMEEFVPKFYVAQNDRVVAFGRYQARVRATKRTYDTEWTHVFTFREGKVVNFREFFDTAAAVAAFSG